MERTLAASTASGDPELIALATTARPLLHGLRAEMLDEIERALAVAREHDNQVLEIVLVCDLREAALGRGEEWGRRAHEIASRAG